ncbi:dolichyl-phosphate beta-glucosyltransferase [Candidatus Bathycorpusculum sp.]|uniref:dolichyl-phosphate beta-glucosyltransferase n=1 Tax=Candidatus Bathycorpusculum sp. TaxID=2994959 RepID=UPI00281EB016|nr:glycosyltransferase family 2 protein [Candidatus Termitimicrobium sp.]MCL2686722.1 glycosyltransferase family 2 protein [Candidatus Termitimicrobium sp.]
MKNHPPQREISVLLPAYNEAIQIKRCIDEVEKALQSFCSSYEIIVSEDGSKDGTDKIVADLAQSNPHLRLLHSPLRLGKGKAIKNAVNAANGRYIAFMDVDLATDLRCLSKLYEVVKLQGGMVIGSRHIKGAAVQRQPTRTLFSLTYNIFVRMLFLDGIYDHQCGFKIMSRNTARSVLGCSRSDGYFFDTELIVCCKRLGYRVTEVAVTWWEKNKGGSKINPARDSIKIALDMFRFRINRQK